MTQPFDAHFDVIVLGSGAAGMTAALVAANEGASVLVLESTAFAGGTSARSSGTVWIAADGDARAYLDALVGDKAERALREAFLAAGPEMIRYLERHAGVRFRPFEHAPDYRQDLPGAASGRRALEPPPFDGRLLGAHFDRLGWPIRELMLFGGMMVTRAEAARLLRVYRSPSAAWLGLRLVARFLRDRLSWERGTRLVLGNALVARLYWNLLERKVPLWFSASTEELIRNSSGVEGVVVEHEGKRLRLQARRAVVLAGGGFPANAEWRSRYLPQPTPANTPAYEGCVGETLRLGLAAGGTLGRPNPDNALWFPSSVARREDGSVAVYPHIVLDRAKPGLVAVGRSGKRFTNEAASYHEFTRGMYRTGNASAWLVCDSRFVWKYGLGMIRPMTPSLKKFLVDGYLVHGRTLEALATAMGVDAQGLAHTVSRNNEYARSGRDPEFNKGGTIYDRAGGDAEHRPNPCLGPIDKAPYYAVRVEPTPLGTSLGLLTDERAQVLDQAGAPVAGLYAVGNDMHSPMGGEYPGAGAQLGPGMTFGFLAALHAVGMRHEQATERRAA